MAKPGALSTKREQLEALAVISVRFDDDVQAKIIGGDGEAAFLLLEAVDIWIANTLHITVQKCCYMLSEWDGWPGLAADPKQFNTELDQYLIGAQVAMRLLYGIPDHRPLAQDNYPIKIAALKKRSPDASWGALSLKFQREYGEKLSANAVERAYKRFVGRVQELVKRKNRMVQEFQRQSDLSEEELVAQLPTDKLVLDILTGETSLTTT